MRRNGGWASFMTRKGPVVIHALMPHTGKGFGPGYGAPAKAFCGATGDIAGNEDDSRKDGGVHCLRCMNFTPTRKFHSRTPAEVRRIREELALYDGRRD